MEALNQKQGNHQGPGKTRQVGRPAQGSQQKIAGRPRRHRRNAPEQLQDKKAKRRERRRVQPTDEGAQELEGHKRISIEVVRKI